MCKTWIEEEKKQEDQNHAVLELVKLKVNYGAYCEIINELKECHYTYDYKITDKPLGEKRDDDEYTFIEGVFVDQTTNGGYSGDEFAGSCSIKISENEYFQFHYSM